VDSRTGRGKVGEEIQETGRQIRGTDEVNAGRSTLTPTCGPLDTEVPDAYIISSKTTILTYSASAMPSGLMSTKEVAAMLHVVETTIKRWADESIIPCVRTPGGHRKFPLKDIVRFAEERGYAVAGSRPPSVAPEQMEQVEFGVYNHSYQRIAEVFRAQVLQANREGIHDLLLYVCRVVPLPVILDDVVRPAFRSIGEGWEAGEIDVGQEHAASQTTMESLIQISSELHRKDPNGLSALCACPGEELHEIGLRGLAYTLESHGWKVHYMGGDTPVKSIASFVRAAHPELVCLSVTVGRHRAELLDGLRALATRIHSYHGKILMGGTYAMKARRHDFPGDYIAASIQEGIAYTRDAFGLKPGPKKAVAR